MEGPVREHLDLPARHCSKMQRVSWKQAQSSLPLRGIPSLKGAASRVGHFQLGVQGDAPQPGVTATHEKGLSTGVWRPKPGHQKVARSPSC